MAAILFKTALLVTMNPQREVFRGDLLVQNDRIARICKHGEHEPRENIDRTIDASGWVMLPGFIQTHSISVKRCFAIKPKVCRCSIG
jgi:cytosine/adenosine deaminase-related metal-dependent hydrolase